MAEFTKAKKVFLSIFCAFSFIIYVPLACAVGNNTSENSEYALAGEISTASEEETTVCSVEDANFTP